MRLASMTAAWVIAAATAGIASAQDVPAPTTTETATQPAAAVDQAPIAEGSKVLVLPFEPIGDAPAGSYDWIGRAVQQNLVSELGRVRTLSTIAPARAAGDRPATDTLAAFDAARKAGADFVVFGSYTLVDPDLRINGQILDVATAQAVGTLKSTGTVRDLFAMEDAIATQVKRLIAPEAFRTSPPTDLATAAPLTQQQQLQQAQQIQQNLMAQPATPVQPIAATPSYVTNYNQYTYYPQRNYGYGYYGYGYYAPACWGGYWGGYCGNGWAVANLNPWVGVTRTHRGSPYVGANGTMVAKGMISVANYGALAGTSRSSPSSSSARAMGSVPNYGRFVGRR